MTGQNLTDTAARIRSSKVSNAGDVVANRVVSGISTVGMGGSIAAFVTYYLDIPKELYAHTAALVIFGWNTAVFLVSFWWRRKFGRNGV